MKPERPDLMDMIRDLQRRNNTLKNLLITSVGTIVIGVLLFFGVR